MRLNFPQAQLRCALLVLLAASCLHPAQADEWEWMVAPYVWAASIGTDQSTRRPPPESGTDFSDIIDKIDGAFQIHIEGQGERFGMFTDFTYLSLADDKDFARVSTSSDLDSRLFELAGVWSPGEGRLKDLEIFGGLRYIDVYLGVGARYTWPFGERWRLTLRGDGSFGDTDGAWNASAVGQYQVEYGAWLFGYRYLSVELEDADHKVDITMNGVMVGFGFIF
jgi:hypothetical protein